MTYCLTANPHYVFNYARSSTNWLNCPVFDRQIGYLIKNPVVCHQHRTSSQRVSGNQQVKRRKYLALALHIGSHGSIILRNGAFPRQHTTRGRNFCTRRWSRLASGRFARPKSSSASVMAEIQSIGLYQGICLIRNKDDYNPQISASLFP